MTSKGQGATSKKRLERPLEDDLLRRARRIANSYRIILEREKGGFRASSIEMPTVLVHGPTANQCEKNIREALTAAVATMIELGRPPPLTARKRTTQVNIRLTPEEKLRLEESARLAGFRGLSDYMRHAAMIAASKSA